MATKRCDRCKKRRVTQYIRVMMERMLPKCKTTTLWYRYRHLCRECRNGCKRQLEGAFQDGIV